MKLHKLVELRVTTHWIEIHHKGQRRTLGDVELEPVELAGHPLNLLTC